MKEFIIDQHAWNCPCQRKKVNDWDKMCELNPERFLFFLGNQFILVTYFTCLSFGDKYLFKKELVELACKKSKFFDRWEVERSIDVKSELRDFRVRNTALRKYIQQVNYLYYDNAGKQYAITTKVKYIDKICDQELIDTNYENAKLSIEKSKYKWLLKELDNLYYANLVHNDYDIEFVKTVDHLLIEINKLTKQ